MLNEIEIKKIEDYQQVDGTIVVPCSGIFDTDKIKLRDESNTKVRAKIDSLYSDLTKEVKEDKVVEAAPVTIEVPGGVFDGNMNFVNAKEEKVENEIKPIKMVDLVPRKEEFNPIVAPIRSENKITSFVDVNKVAEDMKVLKNSAKKVSSNFELESEEKEEAPVNVINSEEVSKEVTTPTAVEEYNDIFSNVKFEMDLDSNKTEDKKEIVKEESPAKVEFSISASTSDLEMLKFQYEKKIEEAKRIKEERESVSKTVDEVNNELARIRDEEQEKIKVFNLKMEEKTKLINEEKQKIEEMKMKAEKAQEEVNKVKKRNAQLDQLLRVV